MKPVNEYTDEQLEKAVTFYRKQTSVLIPSAMSGNLLSSVEGEFLMDSDGCEGLYPEVIDMLEILLVRHTRTLVEVLDEQAKRTVADRLSKTKLEAV